MPIKIASDGYTVHDLNGPLDRRDSGGERLRLLKQQYDSLMRSQARASTDVPLAPYFDDYVAGGSGDRLRSGELVTDQYVRENEEMRKSPTGESVSRMYRQIAWPQESPHSLWNTPFQRVQPRSEEDRRTELGLGRQQAR